MVRIAPIASRGPCETPNRTRILERREQRNIVDMLVGIDVRETRRDLMTERIAGSIEQFR
jgi:hypothetical protein